MSVKDQKEKINIVQSRLKFLTFLRSIIHTLYLFFRKHQVIVIEQLLKRWTLHNHNSHHSWKCWGGRHGGRHWKCWGGRHYWVVRHESVPAVGYFVAAFLFHWNKGEQQQEKEKKRKKKKRERSLLVSKRPEKKNTAGQWHKQCLCHLKYLT